MSTPRECTFDAQGCYVCPELPAVPFKPAATTVDPLLGWNAGADSIATLDGAVRVAWAFDTPPTGVVLGLKGDRYLPTEVSLIAHGLYVYTVGANSFVAVYESGKKIGTDQSYTVGTLLEIRRVGAYVTYWNDGVLVTTSAAKLSGPVFVNACLYSAGDSVP